MATSLYAKRELRRKFLGLRNERPKAEPGQALVLLGADAPIVLYPGQTVSPGESVWGKHDTIYEVDITQKHLEFRFSSPAQGGVWEFTVSFSGNYQVSDPVAVINQGLQDPTQTLRLEITRMVDSVTQQYDIEDSESARRAVLARLEQGFRKEIPFTLSSFVVKLEPDNEAREYLKEKRRQLRQADLIKGKEKVVVAQGGIAKIERQLQREGEAEMVDHYERILEKGITSILAQQLAQNPGNAPQITNFLLQLHQQDVQGKVQMLQTMLDNDMIEDWQLEELVNNVVKGATSGPLQSTPALGDSSQRKALPDAGKDQEDATDHSSDEQ